MNRATVRAGLFACGLLVASGSALGHGGRYRGPVDLVPPYRAGSTAPARWSEPDPDDWRCWWELNKDPWLLPVPVVVHDVFGPRRGAGKDIFRPTLRQIREEVVPALERALRNETNNDIVTGCLVALAKIGELDPEGPEHRTERLIASFLMEDHQEVSETAAIALGILGHGHSLSALRHLMLDTPEGRLLAGRGEICWRTRTFAVYGLAALGDSTPYERIRREIVQALAAGMRTRRVPYYELPVACALSMGLVRLETMLPGEVPADGEDGTITCRSQQIDFLMEALEDGAIAPLVRAHVPVAVVRLLDGLPEPYSTRYRGRVAHALLVYVEPGTHHHREIVRGSIIALGLLGDADDEPIDRIIRNALLHKRWKTGDPGLRRFAVIARAEVGGDPGNGDEAEDGAERVAKHLVRRIWADPPVARSWTALAIGVLARRLLDADRGIGLDTDLKRTLRESLLETTDSSCVGAHAIAIGICGDVEAMPILQEKLREATDHETKGYLSLGLGLLGEPDNIELVREVMQQSRYRPDLLRQASLALGLLGDAKLAAELLDMLTEARGYYSQAAICAALGTIGDRRSIGPLIAMLENEDLPGSTRGFAASALGIIASQEPLPWTSKLAADLNYRAATYTLVDLNGCGILNIL